MALGVGVLIIMLGVFRRRLRSLGLGGEIFSIGTARLYSYLASFAALVLTARWLGPAGRGTLATAYAAVLLVGTIGYLSLGQVAMHDALRKNRSAWLAAALGSLLAVAGSVSLIGWLATATIIAASGGDVSGIPAEVLVTAMVLLPFFVWEQYGSCLLMAVGRIDVYNRAQMVGRTVGLTCLVVILVAGGGVIGALVALALGQAVVAVFGTRRLRAEAGGVMHFDAQLARRLLAGGVKLHPTAVGLFLISGADILIVNHYSGSRETAYYQLGVQVLIVLTLLPQARSLLLFNRLSAQGPRALWSEQRHLIMVTMLVVCGIGAAGAALAPVGVPLLFGEEYRPSVHMLQGLLLSLPGMTMAALMASQWIGRGLFWQSSLLTVLVGGINLALCLALVPSRGATGAVIATVASYTLAFITNLVLAAWCEREHRADYSRAGTAAASPKGVGG